MFILMALEGPVITIISSFGASFGYFNIGIVILLSILGDYVGDTFPFLFG
jgi:membrane protein DedA with SNARE-associated domain